MGWFSDAASWVGDRVSAVATNTYNAAASVVETAVDVVTHPIETAVAVKDAVVDTAVAVKDGAVAAGEWVADKAVVAGNAIADTASYVYNNPGEAWEATKNGIATAATEVKNFGVYCYENPGRAAAMVGQGLTNAVVATGGSIADLGIMLHNNTTRHLINGGLSFVGLEDSQLDKVDYNCTDNWIAGTTFIKPTNGYERTIVYGTQAIGEIGSFVALSVATGGGYAGLRGAAAGARGATLVARVGEAAARTARIVSPLASKWAAVAELGAASASFTSGMIVSTKEADLDAHLKKSAGLDDDQLMHMTLDEKVEQVEAVANRELDKALLEGGYTAQQIEGLTLEQKADQVELMAQNAEEVAAANASTAIHEQEERMNAQLAKIGLSEEEIGQMSLDQKVDRVELYADQRLTEALQRLGVSAEELDGMSLEQKADRVDQIVDQMEAEENGGPESTTSASKNNVPGGIQSDVPVSTSFSSAATDREAVETADVKNQPRVPAMSLGQ